MIVLAHGWGFDARLWDPVLAEIGDLPTLALDLGFLGEPHHLDPASWPGDRILGVGHSLGLLWLLRHARGRCRGLLAVSGFPCFTERHDFRPAVPRRVVAAMARRVREAPGETLAAFRARAGVAGPPPDRIEPARLAEGLAWLMAWDERPGLEDLDLAALAGEDDLIVPPAMTRAAFPASRITWIAGGHHVLPLQHPGRVAAAIRRCWEGR